MYPIYTQASGAEAHVAAPYPADHPGMPYGHDLDAMAAQIDADTRVVFIANPNNPTGTWIEADALTAFLDRVPQDVVIVLDEAYTEYVELAGFPNGMQLLSRYPNMIVTRTFSKIYGLAALTSIATGRAEPGMIEQIALGLINLKFSRGHETEADTYSVIYLCGTDYHADGAAGFFRKMEGVPPAKYRKTNAANAGERSIRPSLDFSDWP